MKRLSSLFQRIRIVLVEPSHPGNIGGTARAMKTMGLHQLVLVNPARDFLILRQIGGLLVLWTFWMGLRW